MKTHAFKKIIFAATVLAALCAAISPQKSVAQTQPAPPDAADQTATPAVLPPDVSPESPLAEVIKLTQAGVSQNIILTYISNSSLAFGLDTDKIIYLTNIGTPDEIVTAMMKHDQALPPQTPDASTQTSPPPPVATDDTPVNFDDTLAPYGNWVVVEGYGRCWRPTVTFYDTAWQPYCDHGHWIYTDDGWYWASDYSWGETFHYGRWFRDSRVGWCWWPDTVWAPSWVAWRYSDDYCGWAPLPPRTVYREGAGFFYNGVAVGANFDFGLGVSLFTFVPVRNFCDPHPHNYRVAPERVPQIYSRTTIINNFGVNNRDRTFVNNGIPPERISAVTHTEIRRVNIRESSAPVPRGEQVGRDTIIVNRPHFADHANPSAPHSDTPRATTSTPGHEQDSPRPAFTRDNGNTSAPHNPPQPRDNNFSQPAPDQNPQRTVRVPQDRTGDSAPVVTRPNPAPGTPFQAPAADSNSHQPVQPQIRQQPGQTGTPNNFDRHPAAPQNVNPPPKNQIVPPAANHSAPEPVQPPERNFTPPQNDQPSAGTRPSRAEPPAFQPQPSAPPAQNPGGTATPPQRNPGKRDNNQNGQQQ